MSGGTGLRIPGCMLSRTLELLSLALKRTPGLALKRRCVVDLDRATEKAQSAMQSGAESRAMLNRNSL